MTTNDTSGMAETLAALLCSGETIPLAVYVIDEPIQLHGVDCVTEHL